MAETRIDALCLVTFLFISFIPISLSRSLMHVNHYQDLDVKASLHKTQNIFTLTRQSFSESLSETPSSLSFTLHPRESVITPKEKDYAGVMKTRLSRDLVRVNSLTTRMQLAIENFTSLDLKPVETSFTQEEFQTPISSGASQGSGEYFTRVGVGKPAKEFLMVIDTGSDISWLQCEPCTECYQQSDPIFNPVSSSTYRQISCSAQQCKALRVSACRMDTCLYQVAYGDGSYTVGDFATDTVSFGGGANSIPNVAIGCGHDNEGLFIGSAGLLALGGGELSFPSQIKATSFSYCLVDRDSSSSSTLDFNSPQPADSVVAPLVHNGKTSTFFYVGLTGLSVGGEALSIPPSLFALDGSGNGGVIVDSGTAVTRLQTQAYNSLRDAFVKLAQHLPSTSGFALFDTCYDLSSMTTASVPTVSFHFSGDKTLQLPPKNYLVPVDSAGKFCLAFAPTSGSLSIIGNIQQQGTRVSYDLANNLVGFSANKC